MSGRNAVLPIQFFKIILQTNLQRIKIPSMFTGRYKFSLPNPMFLKPRDGTKWKVYWKKQNNGEVWLEKGWKEFTQNYSMELGYLVVFKYEGERNSHFDVLIFDKSDVEIDNCSGESDDDTFDEKNILDDSGNDESVEILDEWPNHKTRQRSPSLCPRPHKKFRGENEIKKTSTERTSSLNWPRGARVQQVAKNCDPIFTITLKPANLAEDRLDLSHEFAVFVRRQQYQKVILVGPGVGYATCKVLIQDGPKRATMLGQGWKQFCKNNNLLPGQKLSFEFEDSAEDNIALVKIVPA